MITSYAQLKTEFDGLPSNRARRKTDYWRGYKAGYEARTFYIRDDGNWTARNWDGSFVKSYERLGYHANTAYFFAGVVASGCRIEDNSNSAWVGQQLLRGI